MKPFGTSDAKQAFKCLEPRPQTLSRNSIFDCQSAGRHGNRMSSMSCGRSYRGATTSWAWFREMGVCHKVCKCMRALKSAMFLVLTPEESANLQFTDDQQVRLRYVHACNLDFPTRILAVQRDEVVAVIERIASAISRLTVANARLCPATTAS